MKNHFTVISEINQWGNSLGLRIPKSFCDFLDLQAGAEITISLTKNKIILQKYEVSEKKSPAKSLKSTKKKSAKNPHTLGKSKSQGKTLFKDKIRLKNSSKSSSLNYLKPSASTKEIW